MESVSASITTLSTASIVLLFVALLAGALLFMEGIFGAFDEDKAAFKGYYTAGFVILLADLIICACAYFHTEGEYTKVAQDICQAYGIQNKASARNSRNASAMDFEQVGRYSLRCEGQ